MGRAIQWFAVAVVWLVVVGAVAGGWTFIAKPALAARAERKVLMTAIKESLETLRQRSKGPIQRPEFENNRTNDELRIINADLIDQIDGRKPVARLPDRSIRVGLDSFAGYAPLRSARMAELLAVEGAKLQVVDDGGDTLKRATQLARGELQAAAITVDALLLAMGTPQSPANAIGGRVSIIAVLDESVGADAIVSHRTGLGNIDGLRKAGAGLVLVGGSASEMLARVLVASFDIPGIVLPGPGTPAGTGVTLLKTQDDVLRQLKSGSPDAARGFALWEPHLSQALSGKSVHTIFDSSRVKGMIVDVLAVNSQWLADQPADARLVIQCWHRALAETTPSARVLADSPKLSAEQAGRIASGIWWKTVSENFAHFGIYTGRAASSCPPLGSIITAVSRVLSETGAMPVSLSDADAQSLIDGSIMRELSTATWHPLSPEMLGEGEIKPAAELPRLGPGWQAQLRELGTLRTGRLVFGRGSSELSDSSRGSIEQLALTLDRFPGTYVVVTGQARSGGDPAANQELAAARAQAALEGLVRAGIARSRFVVTTALPTNDEADAQSVVFVLAEVAP